MERRPSLQRLLFGLTCSVALLLVVLVLVAPLFDAHDQVPEGWHRLIAVFSRDATLRRTSLASAAGLVVTACVFFRSIEPAQRI